MPLVFPIGPPPAAAPPPTVIGRSALGRPIVAIERGDPFAGRRVLVVGCIHGTECAGMRVVRLLMHHPAPAGVDLWLVPNLNPDGLALGTRLNGRGVDLNRNVPTGWRPIGRRFDLQYAGPRPWSAVESQVARRLILRLRPDVTIWYHQHMNLVWSWGSSRGDGWAYARAAGMRDRPAAWLAGTAPHWQNVALRERSFVVELPAGRLSAAAAARHARAVDVVAALPG